MINNESANYNTIGKNDECYTPAYGVTPLLEYIKPNDIVWCPFDDENSEFVKIFKKNNIKVIYSHIKYGQDFFKYEPKEKWTILISNPPFTRKKEIFERALSFNKPFALLMTASCLNDSAPVKLFLNRNLEILHFTKRMKFKNCGNTIPFKAIYYCSDFLPKGNIMKELKIK